MLFNNTSNTFKISSVWNVMAECWELFLFYLAYFPVHIPLLHGGEPPCCDWVSCGHIYSYQPVVGHPKHVFFLASLKPEKKTTPNLSADLVCNDSCLKMHLTCLPAKVKKKEWEIHNSLYARLWVATSPQNTETCWFSSSLRWKWGTTAAEFPANRKFWAGQNKGRTKQVKKVPFTKAEKSLTWLLLVCSVIFILPLNFLSLD